jgi:hypothetical protein
MMAAAYTGDPRLPRKMPLIGSDDGYGKRE